MKHTPDAKPKVSRTATDLAETAESQRTTGDANSSDKAEAPECDTEDAPDQYAVGYGRPPLASRFKSGQSGNSKGRKKHSRNSRKIIEEVLDEKIQIREKGRGRRMSRFEALVRTILSRAFKGDPRAVASLLVLVRHYGYGAEHDESAVELLSGSDPKAIIADYLRRYTTDIPTTAKPASNTEPSAISAISPIKPK